jgi:hypothetical protein
VNVGFFSKSATCVFICLTLEKFEYTKGVIRIRISKKDRQYNGQKKKTDNTMTKRKRQDNTMVKRKRETIQWPKEKDKTIQ